MTKKIVVKSLILLVSLTFLGTTTVNSLYTETSALTFLKPDEIIPSKIQSNPVWPMYGYDHRITGLSPYTTAGNEGVEKWRFPLKGVDGGPSIGSDETIYFLGYDGENEYLYAVTPDGKLKWKYSPDPVWDARPITPAIGKNGIIYVSGQEWSGKAYPEYLYAINPDGTLRWKYSVSASSESPIIGDDGTIYFVSDVVNKCVIALTPEGEIKWDYKLPLAVTTSPAVANDGSVYFATYDILYALDSNGQLKWTFDLKNYSYYTYIYSTPAVGKDGTIYFGTYSRPEMPGICRFFALNPDGTEKWSFVPGEDIGWAVTTSPSIDNEGTIYFGCFGDRIYAFYPNGTMKWEHETDTNFVPVEKITISNDGTLYVGISIDAPYAKGAALIAIDSKYGKEKWKRILLKDSGWISSPPVIGKDGTVYILSQDIAFYDVGFLHAIYCGPYNNPPTKPSIKGPTFGIAGKNYEYTILSIDPEGKNITYFVEWDYYGEAYGPFPSGELVTLNHTWTVIGYQDMTVVAIDEDGMMSDRAVLDIYMPRNRSLVNLISRILYLHKQKL